MYIIERDIISNPEASLQYEWLETNGLGSYASSSIYECNTRKYHGLLVAPVPQYGSRYVLLSKYLTHIVQKKTRFELSTCKFPGVYHPSGHKYMNYFSYEHNYPQFLYQIGTAKILKSIVMLHNRHAVLVRYDIVESDFKLHIQNSPLLAYREYHALQKNNFSVNKTMQKKKNAWHISPYDGMPSLYFSTNRPTQFFTAPEWYENVEHIKEQVRGYDYLEDLFSPGVFETTADTSEHVMMLASTDYIDVPLEELWQDEMDYRKKRTAQIQKKIPKDLSAHSAFQDLLQNSYKFIINEHREKQPSIIAGFPWFGEWGRDSLISLPGLTLYSGEQEDLFLAIMRTFASHIRNGLIPNQLNVYGESSYNSVDASLWFFRALQQYVLFHKESDKAKTRIHKEFGNAMGEILEAFLGNKVPHVSLAASGLLLVGDAHTQLTWMDASVNGEPVTPRHGHPIDINALWYNALKFFVEIHTFNKSTTFRALAAPVQSAIDALEQNFFSHYFVEDGNFLCDTIIDNTQIKEMRPNQLLAISLPHSTIPMDVAKNILEIITQQLFTPYGIRTLSPSDPAYQGVYHGSQAERDAQYHQGIIWPFLLGHYTDAFIKVYKKDKTALRELRKKILDNLSHELYVQGIASLSEIYDADLPHTPRGCPFQAWSVAETIRAMYLLTEAIP